MFSIKFCMPVKLRRLNFNYRQILLKLLLVVCGLKPGLNPKDLDSDDEDSDSADPTLSQQKWNDTDH